MVASSHRPEPDPIHGHVRGRRISLSHRMRWIVPKRVISSWLEVVSIFNCYLYYLASLRPIFERKLGFITVKHRQALTLWKHLHDVFLFFERLGKHLKPYIAQCETFSLNAPLVRLTKSFRKYRQLLHREGCCELMFKRQYWYCLPYS